MLKKTSMRKDHCCMVETRGYASASPVAHGMRQLVEVRSHSDYTLVHFKLDICLYCHFLFKRIQLNRVATKMPESLFVLVPGYGEPNTAIKSQILTHNISKICSYKWASLKIRICVYDQTKLPSQICQHPNVEICRRSPALPGNFIKDFARPDDISEDNILILFDDILLMPDIDWERLLKLKDYFNLDIVSPTLTRDSKHVYQYMLTEPGNGYDLKIGPCCEFFCYLFDKQTYKKYYEHVDPDINPWLWGLDLILYKQFGFRVGLVNSMTMKHFFAQTSYASVPQHDPREGYFKTMDKYGIDHNVLSEQPQAFFYIKQSSHI